MVAGLPNVERRLPDESNMTREDALDAFLAVLNVCKPDHPYQDEDEVYPVSRENVEYGYCTSYYGKCGPRSGRNDAAYFSNMRYVNDWSTERHLAMLTHEVTHVTHCSDFYEGSHPPAFWREMAFHAHLVCDRHAELSAVFGTWSIEEYLRCIIEGEVNNANIDRRRTSKSEKRNEMRDLLPDPEDYLSQATIEHESQPMAADDD